MIKILVIFALFFINNAVFGQITPINKDFRDKIVSGIYKIEGGNRTRFPFGIKSIDTGGNYEKSKRICENTVTNNWIRYQKLNLEEKKKFHCYLDFLASRYCPSSDDPIGHKNWIRNIHSFIDK